MAGLHQCPFDSRSFIQSIRQRDNPMRLGGYVNKIVYHISTSNCPHPPLKDFVFGGSIEGCTPLLLACSFGNLEDVKHIVKNWGVDVRTAGKIYLPLPRESQFELDIVIEKATPLFVASLYGHLSIARYLLEEGADLSAKTSTRSCPQLDGLTPLHAPFRFLPESSDWVTAMEIVQFLLQSGADPSVLPADGFPIWTSPIMTSCYFEFVFEVATELINHGLDLEQRCPHGKTMMHYWSHLSWCSSIEEKEDAVPYSLAIVKLLLEKGADPMARDEEGLTPILTAANVTYGSPGLNNLIVLEFLLQRGDIELEEKIKAMELAGAIIIGGPENGQLEKGFEYLRRAQRLHDSETDGSNTLSKTPLNLRNGRTVEWITSQELEDVIQHRSKHKIQSFLIQLRILSSLSSGSCFDALNSLFRNCYFWLSFSQDTFAELLDILLVILETINRSEFHDSMKISVAKKIVKTISQMNADPLLNVTTIKSTLELILASKTSNFGENRHLIKLVTVLANYPLLMGSKDNMDLLSELVRQDGGDQIGRSLLQRALTETNRADLLATVNLLILVKANPSAVDHDGNAPLHFIYNLEQDLGDSIAQLLLDSGACLLLVNKSGKTAKDLWIEFKSRNRTEDQGALQWNDLPSWIRETIPQLKCMSGRVVRVHQLPVKHVPVTIQHFIKKH